MLTVSVMSVCAGLFAIASCTRTTDRVLEPVGGGDASTTAPEVGDASLAPIGPVAHPSSPAASPLRQPEKEQEEPSEDFRLARSPQLGLGLSARTEVHFATSEIKTDNGLPGAGSSGTSGTAGSSAGGPGRGRPVATGGAAYF